MKAIGISPFLRKTSSVAYPGAAIGTVFTDQFARASLGTDYTIDGAATWTTDGVKMTTAGGSGVFTNRLRRSANPTCLEKHSITVDFKQTSVIGTTTYGIAIGVYGSNTNDRRSYAIQIQTSTGANIGKSFMQVATGTTPTYSLKATSSGSIAVNQNDLLRAVITRDKNVITWTVYNLTLGTSYTESYTFVYTYVAAAVVPHGGGQFVLHSLGGTINITDWTVSSQDKKNVKSLFIGDSITYGLFADSSSGRWSEKTMLGSVNSFTISGGSSDKTSEVLARINELILINPKYAVLMIGGNDVFFTIADATRNANYLSIVNQLKAAGITVIHCYATPRDATNLTGWNAHIAATYPTDTIIDVFNPLTTTPGVSTDLAVAYDSTDGTHPNSAGHTLIGSTIYSAFPAIR